jgi:hypothetical protein
MRFMMIMIPAVYQKPQDPNFAPPPEAFEKMMKYNEALAKAGVLLSLDGLHPPEKGARIRFDGGKAIVKGGPFTEAKEIVGGFWMLQTKSKEEAVEWAKRIPAEPGDVVELRQVFEMGDYPAELEGTPEVKAVEAAIAKK